jgi:hypothetical protein
MSQRALTGAGVAVAAAAGYYLYSAGGDPKLAEKKAECMLGECARLREILTQLQMTHLVLSVARSRPRKVPQWAQHKSGLRLTAP